MELVAQGEIVPIDKETVSNLPVSIILEVTGVITSLVIAIMDTISVHGLLQIIGMILLTLTVL